MEGRWTADWWTLASPERPLGLGLALLENAVFATGHTRMKHPQKFYQPLAIGAPAPLRELPVRLERMIHFVPPHIEKLRAKVPDLIREVDVVLGNLEDAIPADAKEAARKGFIEMVKANTFGATG